MAAKSQRISILLGILFIALIAATAMLIGNYTLKPEQEVTQGEIEVSEYRVACKFPGRIVALKVKEGDMVRKGDTLAVLELPEAHEQEKVMEATAGAAQAMSDLASGPTRAEVVESAYQVYKQAVTANEIAEKTYGRLSRLFDEGVVSAQKRDEAEAAYKTTKAAVELARSQWQLAQKGAQEETKRAAQKQAQAAQSAVNVVKSMLKEAVQVATDDGEVAAIFPKVGELVGLGSPIMNIAMVDDVWATFNIREDKLNNMKVGTEFTAFLPAYNKDIKMKVVALKDLGSYAVWKATKTTDQYDLKTFQVKAKPLTKVDGLKPGMTVIIK